MKPQIVSFHCVLKNVLGQVISTSFNRDVITQISGGTEMEIPGFPAGLKEVTSGEHRNFTVKASEAYGLYNPSLVREASRKSLGTTGPLSEGDRMHLPAPSGEYRSYRVTKIIGDVVYLDANHPLAGQDLVFSVHVVDARDATDEEILESSETVKKPYLH